MAASPVPTALVTGASRGIGRAIAIALAGVGYDVAITARTVREGDGVDERGRPLPGSLEQTALEIEAHGRRAVPLAMDLLEVDSLAPTVDRAVDALGGRLDVLVNNAIFVGAGNDRRLVDSEPEDLVGRVVGNLTAQLLITRRVLQHLLATGGGIVVDISSGAGQSTPGAPADEGGWSLAYAATKAGFHRIADMVALECGDRGVRAFNVNPGFVATERVLAAGPALAHIARRGIAPEVVGQVVAWLVTAPPGTVTNGGYVQAVDVAHELGLLETGT